MIDLIEAKRMAEKAFIGQFDFGGISISHPCVNDIYLEEKNCWMFFKHETLMKIPEGTGLILDVACVVSKLGNVGIVGNYFHDLEEAKKYNKELSDYFERINE